MQNSNKPIVWDADALNILAAKQELLQRFEIGRIESNREIVLTPHLGEFARLIKHPVSQLQKDVIGYCIIGTKIETIDTINPAVAIPFVFCV